jgi:hypothetical protein
MKIGCTQMHTSQIRESAGSACAKASPERGDHRRRRIDALPDRLEAALPQFVHEQHGVVGRILDDE